MKSAIFFERDGILNLVKIERQRQVSPLSLDEFQVNGAALEPLQGLNKLQTINLSRTKVTPKGVAELQKALPKAKINK